MVSILGQLLWHSAGSREPGVINHGELIKARLSERGYSFRRKLSPWVEGGSSASLYPVAKILMHQTEWEQGEHREGL